MSATLDRGEREYQSLHLADVLSENTYEECRFI